MIIEVCGPGCPKCRIAKQNVRQALPELGLKEGEDALVSEIKDPLMIEARGVLLTLAVVIDGEKVAEGRIAEVAEAKEWIKKRLM